MNDLTFGEWIKTGIENNWCGAPVCSTHDGIPMSNKEEEMWDEGSDPCVHVVRMYEDLETKIEVEEAHSPSKWRNHYTQ
jgi:hypothetical protein